EPFPPKAPLQDGHGKWASFRPDNRFESVEVSLLHGFALHNLAGWIFAFDPSGQALFKVVERFLAVRSRDYQAIVRPYSVSGSIGIEQGNLGRRENRLPTHGQIECKFELLLLPSIFA